MAPQPEETLTSRGSGVVALQLQELTPANRVPVLYSSIQLYTCILGTCWADLLSGHYSPAGSCVTLILALNGIRCM